MNNYFRLSDRAVGELAESTIITPIASNNTIVISIIKSQGFFKKLEYFLPLFVFSTYLSISYT